MRRCQRLAKTAGRALSFRGLGGPLEGMRLRPNRSTYFLRGLFARPGLPLCRLGTGHDLEGRREQLYELWEELA